MKAIDQLRETAKPLRDGLRGWDGMAIELEHAERIYNEVRELQPRLVIESGAGRGCASVFIAQALDDNGHGLLVSYEPVAEFRAEATERLAALPAQVWEGDSRDINHMDCPDIVFLDSGPTTRKTEIDFWLGVPFGTWRPLLIVHDANRDYGLPEGDLDTRGDGLWLGRAV